MKKKICMFIIIFLIGFCFLIDFNSYGQDSKEVEQINILLEDYKADISNWVFQKNIIIILLTIVAVLGAITGILQKYHEKRKVRITTIIIGAVISIIVVVNNVIFRVDHRTLSETIQRGRQIINDVRMELIRGCPTSDKDARDEWFNKIQGKLHKFPILITNINNDNKSFNLVPIAYALPRERERVPFWFSNPPTDRINLSFVGIGDSSSLKKAKEYSLNNAIENAINYLELQFISELRIEPVRLDIKSLSEYVVKSGKVNDTYFIYNRARNYYRYYTLLKLNKRNAEIDIKFFAVKIKRYLPRELNQALISPQQSTQDYYLRRTPVYINFLNSTRESLSPQIYEKFMDGLLLQKNDQNKGAIGLFKEVIKEKPTFYFSWYYLALSYDSLNDFVRANQAYEKAAELESNQPIRDASFYNTYGYFLYKHKKYEEAIIQLKKALEIDPNHPKAKRNLRAAGEAIR